MESLHHLKSFRILLAMCCKVGHAHALQTSKPCKGDFLHPNLTVRETLQTSAMLRLPSRISHEAKLNVVEEVIRELGLSHCADTPIGDERVCTLYCFTPSRLPDVLIEPRSIRRREEARQYCNANAYKSEYVFIQCT